MSYFVYKLIAPRPTFDKDMTEDERAIMGRHMAYWENLADRGTALVFGPVSDPAGVWGLAVDEADSEDDVRALGHADPAVESDLATFDIFPMPGAIVERQTLQAT